MKSVQVPSIEDAVEVVRAACKRARKPSTLSNRMDFLQARDDRRLLGCATDQLSPSDIDHYVDECGGKLPPGELAYFLPRICTILSTGRPLLPEFGWDESFCFLRFSRFPDAWPDDRVVAMQDFCAALLVSFLEDPAKFSTALSDPAPHIGSMMCAMMRCGIDARALLDAVDTCDAALVASSLQVWVKDQDVETATEDLEPLFDHYWSMVAERALVEAWVLRRLKDAGG